MMLKRIWIPSPNYSARNSAVRLIVLHTAEGALSYQSLGNYFFQSSSGVSSHVGIDDTPSTIGEYVVRGNKAWTQANANPFSVSAELCGFAQWDRAEWGRHQIMLQNTAQWIREEADIFSIPIRKLTPNEAQNGIAGICQHVDLGSLGGGHWDCGPNFPIDNVIAMALEKPIPPKPPNSGDDMFIKENNGTVYQLVYDGKNSYWREIPSGLVQNLDVEIIVNDPNGSWLKLWKVGASA